jgi:hypothetical protein
MKSLQDKLIPDSMKSQVLVASKYEDPQVLKQRREMAQSRSVSELSKISTFSDFPLPTSFEKMVSTNKRIKKSKSVTTACRDYSHLSPMALHDTIYSTLPRSMKSELLVRSRVESPEVLKTRQELVQSKSVSELSQVRTLADLPIPTPIENLLNVRKRKRSGDDDNISHMTWYEIRTHSFLRSDTSCTPFGFRMTGRSSRIVNYDIYASLPSSLKREVLVRSKLDGDYDTLQKRKAIVESKSPAELSQITNFSEIPLPRMIEDWLHNSQQTKGSR